MPASKTDRDPERAIQPAVQSADAWLAILFTIQFAYKSASRLSRQAGPWVSRFSRRAGLWVSRFSRLDFKVVKAGRALETAATSEASVVALCSGGGRGGSVIFGQVITGAHIVKLLENVQNRSMLTIEVASAATLLLNHGWRARKGWKCNLQIYCPKIQNRKYACVCSPLRCSSGLASTCTVLLPISPFSPKHGLMSGDFLASTFS